MPTPTEPGTYRFRIIGPDGEAGPWLVVEVIFPPAFVPPDMLLWAYSARWKGGRPVRDLAEQGEWGPRIPGPEQLEAMLEMAQACPLDGPDACGQVCCRFCAEAWQTPKGEGWEYAHAPDCPWLRAQEKPR